MIKAAIFDMDGLLIDSEPLWRKAFEEAVRPSGIHPTDKDWVSHQGQGIDQALEYYVNKYEAAKAAPIKDIKQAIIHDMVRLIKSEGVILPGVQSTLDICKKQGLKMAVASSSQHIIIDAAMEKLGLRDYFDVIYSGQTESHGKPHPGVFISAAAKLGVEPRYCVVFEDAPSGVLAAKAAKMKCVAVVEPHVKDHSYVGTADLVLDSLEEFNDKTLASL